MSKQQSMRRCWRCGPVSLSHRCESEQRPQAKMRGPTSGLTTGPAWGSARWAAHLRGKVEAGAKAVAAGALEHEWKVLVGDVWSWNGSNGNQDRFEVTSVKGEDVDLVWSSGKHGIGDVPAITKYWKLISRAQKAERALEWRVGARVKCTFGYGDVNVGDLGEIRWLYEDESASVRFDRVSFRCLPKSMLELVRAVGVE